MINTSGKYSGQEFTVYYVDNALFDLMEEEFGLVLVEYWGMIKSYYKSVSDFEHKDDVIRLESGISFVGINVARTVFVIKDMESFLED